MPPDSIKIPDISAEEDVMVIHRNIGLGKDLDWLKDLQAQKILLISKDSQQQRRLKLQLLQDSRFIVLTEEEAAVSQILFLQKRISQLEAELEPLGKRATEAEASLSDLERETKEKAQQSEQILQSLKEQIQGLESQNQTLQSENNSLTKQLKMQEVQLELLRDLLSQRETTPEKGSKDDWEAADKALPSLGPCATAMGSGRLGDVDSLG